MSNPKSLHDQMSDIFHRDAYLRWQALRRTDDAAELRRRIEKALTMLEDIIDGGIDGNVARDTAVDRIIRVLEIGRETP